MEKKPIWKQRQDKILNLIHYYNVKSIIEFGCGDGKFISSLYSKNIIDKFAAIDKNMHKIDKLKNRFPCIDFYAASFLEYNEKFSYYDCIIAIEVIEHLTDMELCILTDIIFGRLKTRIVIFTTPNIEYNINYPILYNGFRNSTHIFEFSPEQLEKFGDSVIIKYNDYKFKTDFCDIDHSSQIILFERSK